MPIANGLNLKTSGSISGAFPCFLRRRSPNTSPASAARPTQIVATTQSPPSCQIRIPSTTPPIPTTDRIAPTTSILRSPGYGTSLPGRAPPAEVFWRAARIWPVLEEPHPDQDDRVDHDLEPEADPPGQVARDEAA